MNRRALLGLSALGLGAVAIDGCANLPFAMAPTLSQEELDRILARLDKTLAALRASKPDARFRLDPKVDVAAGHRSFTRALSTMLVMGTYRDLPDHAKKHPKVHERIEGSIPEMYETIAAARDHMIEMDDAAFSHIDKKLRADPELPMRVVETIDELAKEQNVSIEHRTFLRTATAQLGWRMRTQGSKAVAQDLTKRWDRGLSAKMQAEGEGEQTKLPPPIRAHFRTHAPYPHIRKSTCSLQPKATIGGRERPIELQWETPEGVAPEPCVFTPSPDAIRGVVRTEPHFQGGVLVTLELQPPANATTEMEDDLREALRDIGNELRRRIELFSVQPSTTRPAERKGDRGESCREDSDCSSKLCVEGTCRSEEETSGSAKLIKQTGKIAKVGLWLLIPPICFVGILVLFVCLIMVIVAGFMSLGGN